LIPTCHIYTERDSNPAWACYATTCFMTEPSSMTIRHSPAFYTARAITSG
jgi:hypothetical protein